MMIVSASSVVYICFMNFVIPCMEVVILAFVYTSSYLRLLRGRRTFHSDPKNLFLSDCVWYILNILYFYRLCRWNIWYRLSFEVPEILIGSSFRFFIYFPHFGGNHAQRFNLCSTFFLLITFTFYCSNLFIMISVTYWK